MKKLLMLIAFLFLPVCVRAESAWRYVAPMPHGRYGHAATVGQDGRIYVMGGLPARPTSEGRLLIPINTGMYSNLVYDPRKDAWEYKDPVPGWEMGRGDFEYFKPEKKRWEGLDYVERKGDSYIFKATSPPEVKGEYRELNRAQLRNTNFSRQGNGVAIVSAKDGKIWWIGGMGEPPAIGRGEDIVFPYDPVLDKWPQVTGEDVKAGGNFLRRTIYHVDIAHMRERRIDHHALVTSDGRIFVMGGHRLDPEVSSDTVQTTQSASSTMECYDPRTNTWEYKKPLSSQRMWFAAAIGPDDRIYLFGGAAGMANKASTPVLNTTEIYDPKTDSWSSGKPMPEPRVGHDAAFASNGKIYVMGGSTGMSDPPLRDVFIYDPAGDSWEKGPSMNTRRSGFASVATPDGKIYAIGGSDVGAYPAREKLNIFLPKEHEVYTGEVQKTVEVLDVSK